MVSDIEVGERYVPEELPENQMNQSGKLEWVDDDVFALVCANMIFEFKFAVECTGFGEITDEGEIVELEGELS